MREFSVNVKDLIRELNFGWNAYLLNMKLYAIFHFLGRRK